MIALKKYQELEYYFKNKTDITFTEMICLLISRFNINKQKYQSYYTNIAEVLKNDKRYEVLNIINDYLITNDKKSLRKLKEGVQKNLIYVLKNI